MKVNYKYILCVLSLTLLLDCKNENGNESEIATVDVDFTVERFDTILSEATVEELPKIKSAFPFLFPKVIDSDWMQRLNGEVQQQVFFEVDKKFKNFETQHAELNSLFKHLKYYDVAFKQPRVITIADYVNYRNKLILEADLLIVNLSNYLGEAHEFYQNIPIYFAENMTPSQMVPDIADKYAKRYNFQGQRKIFLDEMIYYGKQLYFKDVMIPEFSDAEKIGYTNNDIEWSQRNEDQVWSYFVENELLFSTDPKLVSRFIAPAPFSKFYLDIDNDSPGRLGQYIGWQIVRAYAERTGSDILTIMRTNADEIFKNSKYKPKR